MRTLVCHFEDMHDVHAHLNSSHTSISFLAGLRLREGEAVRLIVAVDDVRQHCTLRVQSTSCTFNGDTLGRHTAKIPPTEGVWLKMFLSKLKTMQDFAYTRAA